ncbi:MFS transporter [Alicyclobacillus ferrooxydans]|uniref:MFS transporter n=1 Tax=Alicyclobacillus ferrooxydans TaxID=471514 RepID=UPI0006D537B7|nr:MFS transporter [Alicyclobacillus ferrooxydans]
MARERVPLSREAWWLLFISGLFALSVSLSNTFVNVYLWKVDKDFRAIGMYNFAVYLLVPVMFFVAGWIAKRRSSVLTLRSGVLLHAGFYALTLWGGKWLAGYPFILGMLMGTAAGFYWCSFNDLSLRFTSSGSRDRFYGMNGVAGSIAGMAAPPVAGFLISFEDRLGGLSGYHLVFGLSLGLFILASFVSVKLSQPPLGLKFQFSTMFQGVRDPSWRRVLIGSSIYGLREGVFLFLIALLLYIATGSEMELGEFFLLQSALSFGAFFLVSRFVHPHNRKVFMGIGAALMACCAALFLFPLRTTTLVWYGAAIAVCLPLFLVPLQGTVFDTIGRLDNEDESDVRMEHIVMREAFTNAGRVVGVGSFVIWIMFDPVGKTIPYLAFAMGLVQLVTWWVLHRIPDLQGTRKGETRVTTPVDGLSLTRRKAR